MKNNFSARVHASAALIALALLFLPSARGKEKPPVVITGDSVKTRLLKIENGQKIYLTELTGNPKIKYGGRELKSDKLIITGADGEICRAEGNVRAYDRAAKSRLTSDNAVYYKHRELVEFTGKPVITAVREENNSTVTIRAGRIEYSIKDDTGYAYEKVILINRDINLSSGRAVFNRKENSAVFYENPFINKNGDIYSGDEIVYHTESGLIVLNKNAHAETLSEKKDPETGKLLKTKTVIDGDRIENYEKGDNLTIIYGSESAPARIEREDSIFTGMKIEIRGDSGEEVTGEDIYIDHKSENVESSGKHFISHKKNGYSALWGDAMLIVKDENTAEETSRIYGDFMEFFEDIDEMHLYGNIKIYCEAGIIKGEMAKYSRSDSNMLVTGNAMVEKKDSVIYSEKIIFNTKTNNTEMTGLISGRGIKNSE